MIKELRFVLPMTPAQYDRGSEYSAAKFAQIQAGYAQGSDSIEITKRETYVDEKTGRTGLFTQRKYNAGNYLPRWISGLLPTSAVTFYEDSYSCFPYYETRIHNDFFGDRLQYSLKAVVCPGNGELDNVFDVDEDILDKRTIQVVDIEAYKWERDHPNTVRLKKFTPDHLEPNWITDMDAKDLCCSYRLLTVKVPIWGFQTKLESWILQFQETVLTQVHQKVFCWADEWAEMTAKDVDDYVCGTQERLKKIAEDKKIKAAAEKGKGKGKEQEKEKEIEKSLEASMVENEPIDPSSASSTSSTKNEKKRRRRRKKGKAKKKESVVEDPIEHTDSSEDM